MKIKCIANSGKSFSENQKKVINSPEYVREYLNVGEIYNVYGIMLCNNSLSYLIYAGSATFEPAEFFVIIDDKIPPMWHYGNFGEKYFDKETAVYAMWGYKEIVNDLIHNSDLVEAKEEAIKIFFKRKFEVDEWEKNKT